MLQCLDITKKYLHIWRLLMKKNIGAVERVVRILAGIGIIIFSFYRAKDPLGISGNSSCADRTYRMVSTLHHFGDFHLQEVQVISRKP